MARLLKLIGLLAAAALLVAVATGCGDDGEQDGPRTLLNKAAAKEIESANVRLRADADVPGFPILGSRLALTGQGPIASNGSGSLPTIDWRVSLRAGGQSFPARLIAVDDGLYIEFQGLAYEADPEMVEQLRPDGDGDSAGDAMSLKRLGIDPSRWLVDPRVEDGDDIGGDSTRLVTGRVNVRAVLDDLLAAARSRDGGDDDGALGDLSGRDLDRVADAIKRATVEVNVDDEDYPRRVFAELRFEVPEDVEDTAIENGTIGIELLLEEIDVEVAPRPPVDPRPLEDLLRFVGVIFGVEEPADLWRTPGS